MNNEYFFSVAGLPFSVSLPADRDIEELLPSFRPFRCGACPERKLIFRLTVFTHSFAADETPMELLDESSNDMGHVRLLRRTGGYRIELSYGTTGDNAHVLMTDALFSHATACLLPEDTNRRLALSSMLRILYAQAVLGRDGVSIHASCISLKGKSYLFLGKSGTGKSTHARQWMKAFPACSLLNDDNPIVRIAEDTVTAYGSPWSGKTPCYKNECYPVAGIVRLRQSAADRFIPLSGPETFVALLPSCSAIRQEVCLQDALYRTLIRIAEQVPVGQLECLPHPEAAQLCFERLGDRKFLND